MLFLIDGNNITCRDRFGAGREHIADLTKRRVYAAMTKWKPTEVIACFDEGRSFRHDMYSEYKSGRTEIEGIGFDLEVARLAYLCCGAKSASMDGFEADDLIASYTAQYDGKVMIFSGDKDLHQLIEKGRVLQVVKAQSRQGVLHPDYVNHETLVEKYGVTPDQWVDYRCLVGDPSDSIAGAKGVGPKGAVDVIQKYGSLPAFFDAPSKYPLPSGLRSRLLEFEGEYETTKSLIVLRKDLQPIGREA